MDGLTGFKTAAEELTDDATVVTDPFHVVQLAGHAWNCVADECSS